MTDMKAPIDQGELVYRNVYRLRSRNLAFGVYDGDRGFIGIREKFGDRYLATEYLGATAVALESKGRIDEPTKVCESLGVKCQVCGEDTSFEESARGWVCADGTCTNPQPKSISNNDLFVALEAFETEELLAYPNAATEALRTPYSVTREVPQ
jgi:hypothetical protein